MELGSDVERLVGLSVELKKVAERAGRRDVAAKADQILALLTEGEDAAGRTGHDNVVIRLLDGLGF